jgi:hypothetical protein
MTSEKDGRFLKLLRMGIGRDMGKRGGRERLEGERGVRARDKSRYQAARASVTDK